MDKKDIMGEGGKQREETKVGKRRVLSQRNERTISKEEA